MIITKKKDFSKILEYLKDKKNVYLFGCDSWAEQWETAGKREVKAMAELLEKEGKNITGSAAPAETCYSMLVKKYFREDKDAVEKADAFLVLVSGAAVKAIADATGDEKPVFPALDSLYLSNVTRYH